MEGFHAYGGLTFQRTDEGVRVRWYDGERLVKSTELDANTWASAVASCTPRGEDGWTFLCASNLWAFGRCDTPTAI
jgi:hypothetical protein